MIGLLEQTNATHLLGERFHCVNGLLKLSETTGVFVNPVPFLLEVLLVAPLHLQL